jgi:hypothetical protein
MESKLNEGALREYSRRYAAKITKNFFDNNEFADGKSILNLSSVNQVNLFIIYQLLRRWSAEINKMKSPYFNYKDKEVKNALKEYANTLSKHIQIKKEDLTPVLELAVEETLLLILSPYDFYCSHIKNWGTSKIRIKDIKTLSKYVKINHKLMASFISKLEKAEGKEIPVEDAMQILNDVFGETNQTPDEIDPFIAEFSSVLPLDINSIYGEGSGVKKSPDSVKPVIKDKESVPTINDQLSKNEKSNTIAAIHATKRIENIKSNLTINQKFMFINQLFDGNTDDFNQVIDFLDNCQSQAEAMDFINSNYLKKSNWVKDSIEVKEFIEVIAKKYA